MIDINTMNEPELDADVDRFVSIVLKRLGHKKYTSYKNNNILSQMLQPWYNCDDCGLQFHVYIAFSSIKHFFCTAHKMGDVLHRNCLDVLITKLMMNIMNQFAAVDLEI